MLELRADYLREAVLLSEKLTFEDAASGNKVFVFTSHDATQLYVMRKETPADLFHFKFEMQFGESDGAYFEGSLLPSDPINNSNGIFVVESEKLARPFGIWHTQRYYEWLQDGLELLQNSGVSLQSVREDG